MTPDEQLNELLSRRPELRPAVEAAQRSKKKVFVGFTALASFTTVTILVSALGVISLRLAAVFCVGTMALGVTLLISGKLTFYSARSTRK